MTSESNGFDDIRQRLSEIVDIVSEDDIDLDEALKLYEEAVKLGIAACDASEINAEAEEAESIPVSGEQSDGERATTA